MLVKQTEIKFEKVFLKKYSYKRRYFIKLHTFISKPDGLIHSKANIENVAACIATTPTNIHDAVSNGSILKRKELNLHVK